MLVSDLVTAISKFAFGRKTPTESDRKDYLFLLNLADCEYFSCAKNSNLLRYEYDIFFNTVDNFVDMPDNYIYGIYNNKIKLKELDEKEGLLFGRSQGNYYFLNNKIYIDRVNLPSKIDPNTGEITQYLTLLMQPKRKQLVEVVTNGALETEIPIYPEEYHLGLVHGAIYYLCQTHEGFITKIAEAKENWKQSKQYLISHYVKGV